jgi:hypothetical protein
MSCLRKLRIEDLIDPPKENKNESHIGLDYIPKNQKVFGHKKRIKP